MSKIVNLSIINLPLLIGSLFLTVFDLTAAVRYYGASVNDSQWNLSSNTRLQCELTHQIANYGQAKFITVASKTLNMAFELDMVRLPSHYALASVTSIPPAWRPGRVAKPISTLEFKKQYNPEMPEKAAWTMLNELEKGFTPTVYYADWHSPYDKVAVGLSAIHFTDVYFQFLTCVDNLLPYSFEDIAYTVLVFVKNSDQLSKESKRRLALIGEYLRYDSQSIGEISIDAYADSHGARYTNMKMSEQRAQKIADFFIEFGIDKSRVKTTGHGEKRHATSNQTELGRITNRRVVIKLNKS